MRKPHRPLLLGHRGARACRSIPENTVESFDRALEDGCDGFEFDVRLTADGQAVICHDPNHGGLEIARGSAKQLAKLPRLEDVLSRYHERAFLDIELKVAGLEKLTVALLRKYRPQKGFMVSSFLPKVLYAIRQEDMGVPLGLICETRVAVLRWNALSVEYVIPHYRRLTAALFRELKYSGKKVVTWTVNDPTAMKQLRALGVDGIISDDTALLCRTLARE